MAEFLGMGRMALFDFDKKKQGRWCNAATEYEGALKRSHLPLLMEKKAMFGKK